MTDPVADCLGGAISPEVAFARLLLAGLDAAAVANAIGAARPEPPTDTWRALHALLDGRAAELDHLAAAIRRTGSDHTAMGGLDGIAAFFDAAVTESPEAGVALYSLGDPAILEAATNEIVQWLLREHLLHSGADVLDFGCGIGRVAASVAPHCRSVLALDVSAGMVAEARRRHPGLAAEVTDGRTVPPGPFDLILLVDSMPYVLQAGLADAIVAGAAASLRPGGALAVLNLSYGRTSAEDEADAARWAAVHGWGWAASHPFRLWDGRAFVWRWHQPI